MLNIIIIKIIMTRNMARTITTRIVPKEEYINNIYLMINSKILMILDVFYFTTLYFIKKISALIQPRIVKWISIAIWLIISYRFTFCPTVFIYISLKLISIIVLRVPFPFLFISVLAE
jgi:hypothetical protein